MDIKKETLEKKKEQHKKYIKTKKFEKVKQAVFERDGHKCVICGRTDSLVCHHTNYRHLGQGNQAEIDDCITICQLEHVCLHRQAFNMNWYSVAHPRNDTDLREVEIENTKVLVRDDGKDFFNGETYKRYKLYPNKKRGNRATINVNGKGIFAHRIVAQAFPEICGEWFDGCEVHHKNQDCTDNRAENLLVLTPEAHQELHKYRLVDYSKENLRIPTHQFNLDGTWVASYSSSIEAAEKTGICKSAIRNCLCGINETSGGYIWVSGDCPKSVKAIRPGTERSAEKNSRAIVAFDINDMFVAEYSGQADAKKKLGITSGAIGNCLRGKSKTAAGYKWQYSDSIQFLNLSYPIVGRIKRWAG